MKIKQSQSKKYDIPLELSGDDFLAYHRVISCTLPMEKSDRLSVTINTDCSISRGSEEVKIEKTGSVTSEVTKSYIVKELHAKLCEKGKYKGSFEILLYDGDGKKINKREFIKLKEIK